MEWIHRPARPRPVMVEMTEMGVSDLGDPVEGLAEKEKIKRVKLERLLLCIVLSEIITIQVRECDYSRITSINHEKTLEKLS